MAAAGAVIGAIGTIGSMAQGLMPMSQGSMNTLNPAQLYMQARTLLSLLPQMKGHYSTLAGLGQNAPDAYETLPQFGQEYTNNILAPSMERNRNNLAALQDRVHGRSNNLLMGKYKTESRLASNSLKQNLMQQDANLRQMSRESAAQRQLQALGGMAGSFGSVMGQSQENWVRQNPTALEYATTGVTGAQSLYQAGRNIYDSLRMSGPVGGGVSAGLGSSLGSV